MTLPSSDVPFTETISLAELNRDETWLQERIWDQPSCLGLGELEGVSKERSVSSGGKLDILLKNPADASMYEVEVMLGDTDASHIIRTIEYWDLIRKKWPQRQHFAVLIAERITKRFFNVIQILSGSVPLIAIQVNAIRTPNGDYLHFTKILDVYEQPDDEISQDGDSYDESFWQKKSQPTLDTAKQLMEVTKPHYGRSRFNFCKWSVNIVKDGKNLMLIRSKANDRVLIELRYSSNREQIQQLLNEHQIEPADKYQHFIFPMSNQAVRDKPELFTQLAKLNDRWWIDKTDD